MKPVVSLTEMVSQRDGPHCGLGLLWTEVLFHEQLRGKIRPCPDTHSATFKHANPHIQLERVRHSLQDRTRVNVANKKLSHLNLGPAIGLDVLPHISGRCVHQQVIPILTPADAEPDHLPPLAVQAVDVHAVLNAAFAAFPLWLRPLVVARFVLVTLGSAVVFLLLATD
jgi:hypothetical protein